MGRMCPVCKIKPGDEVGPTDDVVRVKKSKRVILEGWDKLDPVQPFGFPPGSMRLINLEPADPENVHPDLV